MASLRLTLFALFSACAPPTVNLGDDTGGAPASADPSIRIIFPEFGSCFELGANGELAMMVSVDVDNFEVVAPGELVDGQGHWHVQLDPADASYDFVVTQFYALERDGLLPGNASITATMVDNGHVNLGGAGTTAIAEVVLHAAGDPCP